jgi:hypothetical protein
VWRKKGKKYLFANGQKFIFPLYREYRDDGAEEEKNEKGCDV